MYNNINGGLMITAMTITEARKKITSLEDTMDYDDTISITNHGKEIFALIKWDTYESICETLEILSDEELSKRRANFIPKKSEVTGYLKRYSQNISSGADGAVYM